MKRPNRLPYKFSQFAIDYYYQYYFQKKHIDEEDNLPILFEIMMMSLYTKESLDLLKSTSNMRKKILHFSKSPFEFVYLFFNYFIHKRSNIHLIQNTYYKLFDAPSPKKILWNDLVYKFKFKHLHPDLNFNFRNPYENSDEVVF